MRLAAVLTRLYQKGTMPTNSADQEDNMPSALRIPADPRRNSLISELILA